MARKCRIFGLFLISFVLLTTISIYSIPRLSLEHATPCVTCHVSPNGGGMRNEFGNFAVSYNELCLQSTKKLVAPYRLKPRLSDNLTYGLDYRMLYLDEGRFFRMQTDLYLSAELLKHVSYNLTFGQTDVKDSYLMFKFKDEHYWLKMGRFYPAFGLRDQDHNAYVRSVPLLGPELNVDGISLGGNFFNGSNITFEFYEPDGQRVTTLHSFRAGALGPVGFLTGLSWRESEAVAGSYRDFPIAKSVFGGLSYDRFTVLGEYGQVGKANEQRTIYAQLASRIVYGLYFLSEYNFHDPNWSVKSGANEFWRFSFEFFPIPFVELRPAITYNGEGPRKDQVDFFVQLHVSY
jgi:hypothetical protein